MSCINVIFPLFFLPSEKPCGNSASCIDFCLSGWLLRHQNVLLHLKCGSWDSCLKVNCLSPLPLKSCRYSNSHTQPRHNPLFFFVCFCTILQGRNTSVLRLQRQLQRQWLHLFHWNAEEIKRVQTWRTKFDRKVRACLELHQVQKQLRVI